MSVEQRPEKETAAERVVPEPLIRFEGAGFESFYGGITYDTIKNPVVVAEENLALVEQEIVDITEMLEKNAKELADKKKGKKRPKTQAEGFMERHGVGSDGDGGTPAGKEVSSDVARTIKEYGLGEKTVSKNGPQRVLWTRKNK